MAERDEPLRVLVVTTDYQNVFEPLYARFAPKQGESIQIVGWVQDGTRLVQETRGYEADVVLLDPRVEGWTEDDLFEVRYNLDKPVAVIGLCPPDGDWPRQFEAMGISSFVSIPLDEARLRSLPVTCHRAVTDVLREQASPEFFRRLAPEVTAALAARGVIKGVYTFFGNKGGVGKTFLAKEAWATVGYGGFSSVLVDLNMAGGRVAWDLGVNPYDPQVPNLFGLASLWLARQKGAAMRDADLNRFLYRYPDRRFRLWVLFGIPKQRMADDEVFLEHGEEFTRWLLRALRRKFDFVMVDIGQDLNRNEHLVALMESDRAFLVVEQSWDCVEGTAEVLEDLRRIGIDSTLSLIHI